MGEVVSDATVLIFLGKLNALDWLAEAYSRVLIPPTVHEEVVVQGKELGARDATLVEDAVDDGWIVVREPETNEQIAKYGLEAGETSALALADERGHEEVLADEESVREVARLLGLRPKGTLSFLFTAITNGAIDFDGFLDLLESLIEDGFYLDESVYLTAVRRARDLSQDDG